MGTTANNSPREISVRYGNTSLTVPVPSGCTVDRVGRLPGNGTGEESILADALAAPLADDSLDRFIESAESPLVVVNDATRSTPTAMILKHIYPALRKNPKWKVIVATGLHRAPTPEELRSILGDVADDADRVLIHDGHDSGRLTPFKTPDGVVHLNSAITEADRLILINSVEPHFFAGYTGGRKSILPGLAGQGTVEQSHAGAVHTDAAPLRVEGNPVREFIHKNTLIFPRARMWGIQVVLDRDDHIAAAFTGDIDKTFSQACRVARNHYAVALNRHYDVVLSAVYPPLDVNLYQAQKAWELSQRGARDGGVLIVTSPCREGVGSAFYTSLSERFPNKGEWLALADKPYSMGAHKLVRTARITGRLRLMVVSGLPGDIVASYGYEPQASLSSALRAAINHAGPGASILVVEDAALTTLTDD